MATFVDTNILVYAFNVQAVLNKWSIDVLSERRKIGALLLDPIVYAEFSAGFQSQQQVDRALSHFDVKLSPCNEIALFSASRAFKIYKARGGSKMNVLADFLIGANAQSRGVPLITRDVGRYKTYFPDLPLIAPPL
jgi:predicted nucleic acid-binding protein